MNVFDKLYRPTELAKPSKNNKSGRGIIPMSYVHLLRNIRDGKLKVANQRSFDRKGRSYQEYWITQREVDKFIESRKDKEPYKSLYESQSKIHN